MVQNLKLITLCLVLSGCVVSMPIQQSIKKDDASQLVATRIINVVPQDELQPVILLNQNEMLLVGGFVGGVLAVSAQKADLEEAYQKLRPLREAIRNIDFRKLQQDQFVPALLTTGWLKASDSTNHNQDIAMERLKADLENGPQNAALTIYTTYYLTPKLTTLTIHSVVKLWMRGRSKPVYIGNFEYESLPIAAEEDADSAVEKWMVSNQAAYRFAISQGLRELTAMIRYEIADRQGVADKGGEAMQLSYTTRDNRGRIQLKGKLVRQVGNRYWIRVPNGFLVSLGKDGLLMSGNQIGDAEIVSAFNPHRTQ